MRLIDANRLKEVFRRNTGYDYADIIDMQPTVDSNSEQAEVQAYFDGEAYGWEQGRKALIDDVKAEIAEEICLTYNPYTNETKYTIDHLKLLDILHRQVESEDEK